MISIELRKGAHRFIVRYSPGEESAVPDALVAMTLNPDTTFDWLDAAVLSHRIGLSLAGKLKEHFVGKK